MVKAAWAAVALTVWYSTSGKYYEDGDYYVDKEMDSYVEDVYLADAGVELVPLKGWLDESEENAVYEVDRNQASHLSESLQTVYGIELKACVDAEFGDSEAFALVGQLGETEDLEALAKTIRKAIPEHSSIEIGEEWFLVEL